MSGSAKMASQMYQSPGMANSREGRRIQRSRYMGVPPRCTTPPAAGSLSVGSQLARAKSVATGRCQRGQTAGSPSLFELKTASIRAMMSENIAQNVVLTEARVQQRDNISWVSSELEPGKIAPLLPPSSSSPSRTIRGSAPTTCLGTSTNASASV